MIENFLDKDNKIYVLPKKRAKRIVIYEYLASKFDDHKVYNEKEVNFILNENHSFNDPCILRYELTSCGFLERLADGSEYKKPKQNKE
ncbi:MAG: DUF2087 domain-containing protein [Lachnospirales bacterium]